MNNHWCRGALLMMMFLGVALAYTEPSEFQKEKYECHFNLADANNDGKVTYSDYELIAKRTCQLPGYKKYTLAYINANIVPAAWAAFPNKTITINDYYQMAGDLLGTQELETRSKALAKAMYALWAIVFNAMTRNDIGGEFQALRNTDNLQNQTDLAYNAMRGTSDVITEAQYCQTAYLFMSSDDPADSSKHFFGEL